MDERIVIMMIIIIHRTIFMVLSSTARSHIQEFTLDPLSESRSAPSGRQLAGKLQTCVWVCL